MLITNKLMMLPSSRNIHVTPTSSLLLFCLLLVVVVAQGKTLTTISTATEWAAPSNDSTLTLSKSKWVQRWRRDPGDPRRDGCRRQPWVCNRGEQRPYRMRCCRNRCVDISSNVDHCGLCARRCPFSWLCCRGRCRNINRNPKHCGRCFNRCPFPIRCRYGMCGYAQSSRPPLQYPPGTTFPI